MEELTQGTYRAKNGDLIRYRDGPAGHVEIEIEHNDGSSTATDASALHDAVRVSDDPAWPIRHPRFLGVLRFR